MPRGLSKNPVGADDRADYEGAGRGEAEEDGRQHGVRLLPIGTSSHKKMTPSLTVRRFYTQR
jgi:hypothetical protein